MPNNLNEICLVGNSGGNLGQTACPYTPTVTFALFAVPDGAVVPPSALDNTTTFAAHAKAQMQATNYADRWQLIYGIIGSDAQGQETGYFSYRDRSRVATQDAIIGARYEHKNGFCYHKQLMNFNGGNYRIIKVRGTLEGVTIIEGTTVTNATTGLEEFTGIANSLFKALPPMQATDTDPERYMIDIDDKSYIESTIKRAVFAVSPSIVQSLAPLGVKDVIIENRTPSGAAAGVFTFRLNVSCGTKSLAETNPTVISNTYIKIRNAATKAEITATLTVVDATDPANIVITADTADADYPATGFVEIYGAPLNVYLTPIGSYSVTPLYIPRS